MDLRTTVVGAHPKPPDEGQPFKVRKTLHALERGDATPDDLEAAFDEATREAIAEQEEAGIDLITDGGVRWDDIVTPFARRIGGFEIGGLIRWFDNNVYYRRPICVGSVEWTEPATVDQFRVASSVATRAVKTIVPGPVTFARLSVDEHYGDHREFVLAIARALAREVAEVEAAGARHIQIDEPALLDAPEDLDLAIEALHVLTSDVSAETTLATYFGDAKRVGGQIYDLPVDVFGFDLVAGPENMELIRQVPADKKIQAGIVDARNTKLETVDELRTLIRDVVSVTGPERVRLAPSAPLEFLPREKARAKLARLVEAAKTGD